MVILSSRISTTDDFIAFVHTVDVVSDAVRRDVEIPLVLHPVGLPAFLGQSDSVPGQISRLREIAARETVQLWNGGYAGAPGVHLTAEEISWDLTWAHTNPWDTGFSRYLNRSATADFPVLLSAAQAHRLEEDRAHSRGAMCVGYAGYTLAPPPPGPHRLWFLERGQWKWLTSLVIGASDRTMTAVPDTVDPVDCVHFILPEGTPSDEDLVRITSAMTPSPRSASSPPRGTFFHSGVGHGHRWLDPDRAAAVAEIRRARTVSRERTAAVLQAAAACSTPEQLASVSETAVSTTAPHDPFQNRELQGGVTGSLRLDTESVGAIFSAGRIAGLTMGEASLTPPVRAQGFTQNTETTRYLETFSAAWFTGLRVRGVHEVAELSGAARLGVTTFAMDQLPGLVMNIMAQPFSAAEPAEIVRQGLLEIPLYDDTPRARTGAILESSGAVREVSILPQLDEESPERAGPVEWSVGGVGLRVDLAQASLWIIAAHPGAVLPVSFSLGARSIPGGIRVSWYPVGFERHSFAAHHGCRQWSVSYRILATNRDTGSLVSPRVEPDLWDEIDGFTCQGALS